MKKKTLFITLAFLLICLLPSFVFAADIKNSGTCGDSLTWTLDSEGTLTISGTGDMYNYSCEAVSPWDEKAPQINAIIIKDSLTSIGNHAFYNCAGVSSVTIPNSVTSIGEDAFSDCSNLSKIYFNGNAPSFGKDSFYHVTATAYYPAKNSTWTASAKQNYGGTLTWEPVATPVSSIKLSKTSVSLTKSKTYTLKATISPSNATNQSVTWKSGNTKVAKVSSSGKVTAVAKGTTTITCTAKDGSKKYAKCKVTVTPPVTSVKLNKTSLSLKKGTTYTLKTTISPSSANKAVTWKSSNTKVAKVSSSGKVTAVAMGTATITCTAKDDSKKYAKCKVTVTFNLATATNEERYHYLFGTKVTYWTTSNKPKGYQTFDQAKSQCVTFTVPVWKLRNGKKVSSTMSITINKKLADDTKKIFKEIYALPEKFPIKDISGFRWSKNGKVSGAMLQETTCMSSHAYGAAIDLNKLDNDYFLGKGNDLRDKKNPYYITKSVRAIFAKHGWFWGGNYEICADTMHFQYTGLDMLFYNNGSPYKVFKVTSPIKSSAKVKNIQRRLNRLGFSCGAEDGKYGQKTANAVMKFQTKYKLKKTGTTTEEFYIKLYNLTHTMSD